MKAIVNAACIAMLLVAATIFNAGCGKSEETATSAGAEGGQIVTAQKLCPVMGHPIDKNVYVNHNGTRIYLCCTECVQKFKDDPETYVKKLQAAGIVPENGHGTEHESHEHDHDAE